MCWRRWSARSAGCRGFARAAEWLRAALVEWLERPGNGPLAETIRRGCSFEKDPDGSATSRGDSTDTVRLEFV